MDEETIRRLWTAVEGTHEIVSGAWNGTAWDDLPDHVQYAFWAAIESVLVPGAPPFPVDTGGFDRRWLDDWDRLKAARATSSPST